MQPWSVRVWTVPELVDLLFAEVSVSAALLIQKKEKKYAHVNAYNMMLFHKNLIFRVLNSETRPILVKTCGS